jgi:hypothetical protein
VPVWTDEARVLRALGDQSGAADDPYLLDCVDAANALAFRKRVEAGYIDDPAADAPAPSADVAVGATMLAVDLYRARGAGDTPMSFDELATFGATSGAWPQIKRLLGIGRAQVDAAAVDADGVVLPFTRYRHSIRRHPSGVRR